ncbi:hypothetical protein [Janibacter terrae]|uniref:hypothetical protein n=1 Tax=Janibacter terrae TaxID=103817 RepID=UPI0031F73DD2
MSAKTLTATAALTLVLMATGCGDEPAPGTSTSIPAPTTSNAPPRGSTPAQDSTSSTTAPSSAPTAAEGRATTPPSTAKGTPRGHLPKPGSVDERNAAAVAAAYLQTTETIDTDVDTSRSDAQRRAARWLTPDLAREVAKGLPGGAGWAQLTKKGAWTKAAVTDVTPSGGDPTKGLTTDRVLQVEVTTYGRSRKPLGDAVTTTTAVTLRRASESKPWRVADMQTY